MSDLGHRINYLVQEAKQRWLRPAEVFFLLENHENIQLSDKPVQRPPSGSLFLFNKRVQRFFRNDGHSWKKKKSGRNVAEGHERLKVGNVEALNCYYAHGEQDSSFQRRSYWMLNPAYEHIVLVHYRDTSERNDSRNSTSQISSGSSTFSQISFSYNDQHASLASDVSENHALLQNPSCPGYKELSSDLVLEDNGRNDMCMIERTEVANVTAEKQSTLASQMLENEFNMDHLSRENKMSNNIQHAALGQIYCMEENVEVDINDIIPQDESGFNGAFSVYDWIGPLETDLTERLEREQRFSIREVSPNWGYSTETTKVIIVGSFLCDSSRFAFTCMFGDVEVPPQIIQEGVLLCEAPPHSPGKVPLYITSGNQVSCSETWEFEYCEKPSICPDSNVSSTEWSSPAELLLLVRFVQILLSDDSDPSIQRRANATGNDLLGKVGSSEEAWDQVLGDLLPSNGSSSNTINWLFLELLKDKLQKWLSSKSHEGNESFLSKREQGIIHIVAGLGFEWALNPVLSSGVNINFRDINGWTALHWAARFGREKMVAALVASGAFPGAITDPNAQDPNGQTPGSIAHLNGHKGLAGYLSELALTNHLSCLTLGENEQSKCFAELEAESTVTDLSLNKNQDLISLEVSLGAVRNAIQAASRIQAAFRDHSFKNRRWKEAAVVIQKRYRGSKGRRAFLALRSKVIKIQAHVRGYQARKRYAVLWAVSIMEKVVLRWVRRGVGLRGLHNKLKFSDESEAEDILKVYRKQKVYPAIGEAVSRVLSLVESLDAREQYQRVVQRLLDINVSNSTCCAKTLGHKC